MKKNTNNKFQQGALLALTLIMLLIISMLGMSALDTTGIEMQMSSNNNAQLRAFEAAEFTLSKVETDLRNSRFSIASIMNNTDICGDICFNMNCSQGYCFDGTSPLDWEKCKLKVPATSPYQTEAFWKNGGGSHLSLALPQQNITAQYLIEFRCYSPFDFSTPIDANNIARAFRVTAFIQTKDKKAQVLLRSTISLGLKTPSSVKLEPRTSWVMLNNYF